MIMRNRSLTNRLNKIALALFLMPGVFSLAVLAQQYAGSPVTKTRLINVLRSKSLQTREIVKVVTNNGVDFQINPANESELTAAGARPEVITAIRDNYRQPVKSKTVAATAKKTKFIGQPLARDAIVTLLQNGVTDAQVRKNVESRGVSFKGNAKTLTDIRQAGGSVALVNLIAASYVDAATSGTNPGGANSSGAVNTGSGGSEDYDTLIDKAVSQYDASKDAPGSIGTLQQAVKLDANNSRAYQLLGFTYLYGQKNFSEAEKYMREAVTRGGSAVFRVFHDHDGLFKETCQGSLFVAKDTVRFESDNNVHTFQTEDASIKQVKMNSIFKTFYKAKAGSFKIVLKSGDDDSVKFSFAPLTDNALESKMIIRLIGKN